MGKNILTKLGIFVTSLFVTAVAIYLYSPVLGSNAADTANTKLTAKVNPVITLTLNTNNLNFEITPNAEGVFSSQPIVATVDTNSTGGYELYFSSIDNNTAMTSYTSESTIASSFANTVTSTTMTANTWGYSLDNTDFSKIPTLDNQATLKNIDHYPTSQERGTTINIGMKINSSLPSGNYTKNVLFSVVAHDTPKTISDLTSMQEMTSSTCNLTGTHETAVVTDERDGNSYHITKLLDGRCWMTDNLRITGKEISSADSDLPDGVTYTIPTSSINGFWNRDVESAYNDPTYGGYYNFYVATAGWGKDSVVEEGAESPQSICPKGWRLPTGGYDTIFDESTGGSTLVLHEYLTMVSYYPTTEALMGIPNFKLNGEIAGGTPMLYDGYSQIDYGMYWSSTVHNAYNGRYLIFTSNGFNNVSDTAGNDNKTVGFGIRCIAD